MEETIRKPIIAKLCDCHNSRIIMYDGVPTYRDVSNCSREEVDKVLNKPVLSRIYVDARKPDWEYAVNRSLERGIPVSISTNKTLSKSWLDRLHNTPNNQIVYRLSSLNSTLSGVIDGWGQAEWYQVMSMMSYAKAMKIHVLTEVEYRPELINLLELFELLTALKNFSGMVHIICNPIDINRMENDITTLGGLGAFNQLRELIIAHYYPIVKDRTWALRPARYQSLVASVESYLKGRKLPHKLIQRVDDNRITTDGSPKSYGIGLRNRVYVNKGEQPTEVLEAPISDKCSDCGGVSLFDLQ